MAIGPTPRTQGTLWLSSKSVGLKSGIDQFRTSGAMKALFPHGEQLQAIMINTSGGLTGGDQITAEVHAGENSHITLTTQAAERAYRAQSGRAEMHSKLHIDEGASLFWLPQEMILFEGSALNRSLTANLAPSARFLMVEPVIFGRAAMGETLNNIWFRDQIRVWRSGSPLYFDGVELAGNFADRQMQAALTAGAGAMASLLYVAPNAAAHLAFIQASLPETAGASLLQDDVLTIRILAEDSHMLRQSLLPILDRLSEDGLPTSWRL